jgi:hypothetical protein
LIPLRNKVAGSILIIGGLFIVYVGYLESIESSLYGIPYPFVRELINNIASHISEDSLASIIRILFEVYLKSWLLTIAGGLCSLGAGILILMGKVSRGKELGHYAEFGLGSLIPPLIFQFFETEYEEILSLIPGVGPVDLEIINLLYFITWGVFLSFYFATWLAVEPAQPTVVQVVQPTPKPPEGKKYCPQCGAEMPADFTFCPKCGAKQ